jgi:hypothetical protein
VTGQTHALPLTGTHVKIRSSKSAAERCESGRIDMLGKHASGQLDRGFESHPLRQIVRARPRVYQSNGRLMAEGMIHVSAFRGWALCNRTL